MADQEVDVRVDSSGMVRVANGDRRGMTRLSVITPGKGGTTVQMDEDTVNEVIAALLKIREVTR